MEISYMLLRNFNLKFKLRIGFMDFQFFFIEHICSEYHIINTFLCSSVSVGNLFYKTHIYTHIYIFNIIYIYNIHIYMQLYIISLYLFCTMHDYEILLKRIQGSRDGLKVLNLKNMLKIIIYLLI